MRMYVFYAFTASFPVFAMTAVAILVIGSRLKQLIWKEKPRKRRHRLGLFAANAALGFAFLTLPVIYRPSVALLVKAQISQQEDADEDDNGDPESPIKRLLRQLRRIRRGEKVDRLILKLE